MPQTTYPSLNMHFRVDFEGSFEDIGFQSVEGLRARICENEDKKGEHTQYENIILKRAYKPDSDLVKWCMDAINNHKKQPLNLIIRLLNAKHEMLSGWQIEQALPVAWGIDELHAQEAKILIETIELKHQRFQILNSKRKVISPLRKIIRRV